MLRLPQTKQLKLLEEPAMDVYDSSFAAVKQYDSHDISDIYIPAIVAIRITPQADVELRLHLEFDFYLFR